MAFTREVLDAVGNDIWALWFLNRFEERYGKLAEATDRRIARQSLIRRIAELAVNGKVAIWESGRDCDCVSYSGYRCLIDANVKAFDELYEHTAEWADGPFHLWVESPERQPEHHSRDLALEAFEDGHPYSIHA